MHERESVDFLKPQREFSPQSEQVQEEVPQKKKRIAIRIIAIIFAFVFLGFSLFAYGITHTTPSEVEGSISLFSSLRHLVSAGDRSSDAAADDRINVLLLGIGGAGHAGAELTDTMILASFKPSTGEVGMISIPRDLTLSVPGHGYTKINAVNAYAEQEEKGSGIEAITQTIETIMDEKVDYTVKVDFSSFEEIIDAIGGIDVYVETAFTDYQYPINGMEDATCFSEETSPSENTENISNETGSETLTQPSGSPYGCRYEVLSFEQGLTHMSGATALKYTRSRHGSNGEGSDFKRAARQQKVLLAWKEKTLSLGVLLNPGKLQNIVNIIRDNVTTNMSAWDMLSLAKYANTIKTDAIASHVIDGNSGLVYDSYLGAAYVLWPRKEDWSEFKNLADNIFSSSGSSTILSTAPATSPLPSVLIEIQNGTKRVGLASQTAQLLQSSGYGVAAIGNAENTNWTKTTIFDFTNGKKDKELAALKDYLNAEIIMTSTGAFTAKEISPDSIWDNETLAQYRTDSTADFVIILGENSGTLVMSTSYGR